MAALAGAVPKKTDCEAKIPLLGPVRDLVAVPGILGPAGGAKADGRSDKGDVQDFSSVRPSLPGVKKSLLL